MARPWRTPDGSLAGDATALLHARYVWAGQPPDEWLGDRRALIQLWLREYERVHGVKARQAVARAVWRILHPPPVRIERFRTGPPEAGRMGYPSLPEPRRRGNPRLRMMARARAVLDAHNVTRDLVTDLLDYLALLPRAARQPGPGRPRRHRPK